VEQELHTPPVFNGVRIARSLVFCIINKKKEKKKKKKKKQAI
jgi:hypothetical protein